MANDIEAFGGAWQYMWDKNELWFESVDRFLDRELIYVSSEELAIPLLLLTCW